MRKIVLILILCFACCQLGIYNYYKTFHAHSVEEKICDSNDITFTKAPDGGGELTYYVHDPSFMKKYFFYNANNFGYNYYGSCGYVAAEILLSYYDTYWNDDIIPEKYDLPGSLSYYNKNLPFLTSPGTCNEEILLHERIEQEISNKEYFTFGYYFDFIKEMKDSFYHLYMLYESEFYGKYSKDDSFREYPIKEGTKKYYYAKYNFGLTVEGFLDMLDWRIYKYGKVITNRSEGLSARNFAISKIKQGIPVILGASNSSASHLVVAYDYDEKTDTIIVHSGYRGVTSTSIESLGYTDYIFSAALELSCSHKCSDNISCSGRNYCACYLDGTHPAHSHHYDYQLVKDNKKYHLAYCICNKSRQDYHSVYEEDIIVDGIHQYAKCILCGEDLDFLYDGPAYLIRFKGNNSIVIDLEVLNNEKKKSNDI